MYIHKIVGPIAIIGIGISTACNSPTTVTYTKIHHKVTGVAGGPVSKDPVANTEHPAPIHPVSSPQFVPKAPIKPDLENTPALQIASKGGAKVELLAVCRMNDSNLSCWNADGKSAPHVTAELGKLKHSLFLPYELLRKNRIFVFRKKSTKDQKTFYSDALQEANGMTLWSNGPMWWNPMSPPVDAPLEVIRATYPPEARSATIDLVEHSPTSMNVTIPLSVGKSVTFEKAKFTITSLGDTVGQPIELSWSNVDPDLVLDIALLDTNGIEIRGTEPAGGLILARPGQEKNENTLNPLQVKPATSMFSSDVKKHIYGFYTQIKRSDIGGLQFRSHYERAIKSRPIPLDPK